MKKYLLLNILLTLLISAGPMVYAGKLGVAATVGDQEISQRKLQTAIDHYLQQQGTNVGAIRDPNRFKAVREKILDVLIGQELLWQAAYKDNTIANDDEVKQALRQYQAQFDNEVTFDIKLQAGGYNKTTFVENLKHQLSAQKWLEEFVLQEVSVSDAEVHAFYLANKQQFSEPETIRARHILIKVEPGSSDEARESALELLKGIKQELDAGAEFESLAKAESQGPSAANGGDLGYFGRGQMVAPFENAAFELAPGEVSGIVETRFGFHLIQLVDRKSPVQTSEQDHAEKIRIYLWQKKSHRAVEDAVARLKSETLIEKSSL
jgi:peptidyl-prolyl cis-trans isomerase C